MLLFLSPPVIQARDIDVDAIYLKKGSPIYNKLITAKFDAYSAAGSLLAEKGVTFSGWSGGSDIAFIRESGDINILYIYNTRTHKSKEICRITGTVTAFRCGSGGFAFIKRITTKDGMPSGGTVSVNLSSGKTSSVPGSFPFMDFSLTPDGRSLLVEMPGGISRYYPESGNYKTLIPAADYSSIRQQSSPVIAYLSPDLTSKLIVSGSGGSYRAVVLRSGGRKSIIEGVTSAAEAEWLDNSRLIFRRGGAGSYSAVLHDVNTKKEMALTGGSLNTNITYTRQAGKGALLDSQILCIYEQNGKALFVTGIEGEDPQISPDGTRITTLFQGRLFITRIDALKRAEPALKKKGAELTALYERAAEDKSLHENDYTARYINTKINAYKKFTGR